MSLDSNWGLFTRKDIAAMKKAKKARTRAKVEYIRGQDVSVEILTELKLIVSMRYRGGYLVARYGVNKSTLQAALNRMDGTK